MHTKTPRFTTASRALACTAGLADLWRNIERYQAQYDLGTTYVPGGLNVIRYPPTFYTWSLFPNHLQRALSGTYAEDYWNRLLGALASAMQSVPIFLILLSLWPHRGAALFGSILNLFCSIDFHYLAQAAYPATMGKLADLSVIAFAVLAVGVRRYYLGIAILVCSALMTYPASWTNQGLLIGFFCLIELFRREWKDLLRIAAAGLGALVAAHLLFYGDLVLALATVHLPAGLAAGSSLSGFGDLFDLRVWFLGEVLTYFSWLNLVVLLAGFLFYWRSSAFGVPKAWMGAWMASLFGLLLLSHVGGALLMYIRPFFFPRRTLWSVRWHRAGLSLGTMRRCGDARSSWRCLRYCSSESCLASQQSSLDFSMTSADGWVSVGCSCTSSE